MNWIRSAGLVAVLACGPLACSSSEQPAPQEAPEQTPAERLVGSWELVSYDGKSLEEQGLEQLTMTFGADGRWTQEAVVGEGADEERDSKWASYVVEGDAVTLTEPGDTHGTLTFSFSGDDELTVLDHTSESKMKLTRAK